MLFYNLACITIYQINDSITYDLNLADIIRYIDLVKNLDFHCSHVLRKGNSLADIISGLSLACLMRNELYFVYDSR